MMSAAPPDEFRTRIANARTTLRSNGLAGLVVSTEANFAYFTGLRFDPLWASAARSLLAVIPAHGPLHLLLPTFIADEAQDEWRDAHVHRYDPPAEGVIPLLMELIGEYPDGPFGFELGAESRLGITAQEWQLLTDALSRDRRSDAQELIWHLRLVKSPFETSCLRTANHANAAAFEAVLQGTLSGLSEREIARQISAAAISGGADRTGWIALTSGAGSYDRFVTAPRERVVEKGDMVWADLGVQVNGYWSDYCRAAVVGGPTATQQDLQAAVMDATAAGVRAARPGAAVATVAAAVRDRSRELGLSSLGFGRVGHGIGLSATEPPSVAGWDTTVLMPGMVITIEPAVVDDTGLYCAEQVIAVTDGEPEVLSIAPSELASAR